MFSHFTSVKRGQQFEMVNNRRSHFGLVLRANKRRANKRDGNIYESKDMEEEKWEKNKTKKKRKLAPQVVVPL